MEQPDPKVVEAIGKASEALETVERARGHLYAFHQLMGHADLAFGEACELLTGAGLGDEAERIDAEIVGRNVVDGRWTFQVVEEFDDLYYAAALGAVRELERVHLGGRRHVYESQMKDDRRTKGSREHARRPPAAHADVVDVDGGR